MRPDLPAWLAAALRAAAGPSDASVVAAAEAAGAGLVQVGHDGSVSWTPEAYRLHGRPRWRRVRGIDDVARGLSQADAGRVTAAYLALAASDDVEILYTVASESGLPLDVLLRGAAPGLAVVERAAYVDRSGAPAAEDDVEDDADAVAEVVALVPVAVAPEPEPEPGPVVAESVADVEVEEEAQHLDDVPAHHLADGERAFRDLFHASPTGLAVLDDDGRFAAVNDAFCRLVGRTRDTLLESAYHVLIHHEDRAAVLLSRTRVDGDDRPISPDEHRLLHSDGTPVWVRTRTSIITLDGEIHLLLSVENVTASRAREEQLRHDALHDSLTGLPNRRLVLDRLDRALSRGRRQGTRTAVLFVDVDDLKDVNDTHPWKHRAGDVLLTSIAMSIRGALRDTDTLGRLGGDEFLAVCEDVGSDAAVDELAERLLDAARTPVPLGSTSHVPAVSIGLAVTGDDDETSAEILERADTAMYLAKSTGGGRVQRAGTVDSHLPGPDLVGAMERGELRMHYQPVVSLATGSVLGLSAVLRWQHPTLGMLPAHEVRTALDSMAMLPVVGWCLDRAIDDVRTVAPSRVDHVSVWLPTPGRALQVPSTVEALRAAIAGRDGTQTPDTAPSLVLDVHEADLAVFSRRPRLRRLVEDLAALGPVALGVEHLSADALPIGSLQLLGAASASIDPELVQAAAENAACEHLVRSLVEGATALGVVTVATGISSTELLDEARRLGVHAVTGDLVGPVASLEIYSDLLHGERITLPGAPAEADSRTDTAEPEPEPEPAPARPLLAAVPSLVSDTDTDTDADDDIDDARIDERALEEDDAPLADASPADTETAPGTAPEVAPAVAAPVATRLLLGDVVDLAEQVARELGVALPPPAEPAAAPADAVRAPGRLPGLHDLHSALAEPEVTRALAERPGAERTDDASEAAGEADTAGVVEASAAVGTGTTDDRHDDVAADVRDEDDDDLDDEDRDEPAGPLVRLREDVVALLRWVAAPTPADDPRRDDDASVDAPADVPADVDGGGTRDERPDAAPARPSTSDVDLRQQGRPVGSDGPTIMLRPSSPDALGSTVHLQGRGGSDGGSFL